MNRYAAEGITNDAYDAGLRIAVLSDSARGARDAFDEIEHHAAGAAHICRANGAERIDYPSGGTITFHRSADHLRGVSADIVYLDGDAERQVHEHGKWEALHAALTTSRDPQVIRA
jgi:hypothetical protein